MTARMLLALAAPATFWMMFGEQPAEAQERSPFAAMRCDRLERDPRLEATQPGPLNDLRATAQADGCDAVVRRVDAQLRLISGANTGSTQPEPRRPDCSMARALTDLALASESREQIVAARETVRECRAEVTRLNEWIEAHPDDSSATLRQLVPWDEFSDAALGQMIGDTHYDEYRVRLQQNEGVAIRLRAESFAPMIAVGSGRVGDGSFSQLNYIVAGMGEEAVLRFQAPYEGVQDYVIVAANDASIESTSFGPYTIVRESWVPPPPLPPTPIAAGRLTPGVITAETVQRSGNARMVYDTWSYQGRAGERLRISMESDEFDAYLIFGRMQDGQFVTIDTDDDGGEGLDSLLPYIVLPDAGEYLIRARTLGGSPGPYTLLVESLPERQTGRIAFDEENAWAIPGMLLADSAVDDAGALYQEFTIRPSESGEYRVVADSWEFNPTVDVSELTRAGARPIDVYSPDESTRSRAETTFTAERRKTYLIRVRSTDVGETGRFNLVVARPPAED